MGLSSDAAPLASWRFTGTLRTYQAEVLDRLAPGGSGPLHVVAPPGSGKTLLGLLLAAREGHRALVLTPTNTIRRQWIRAARDLAPQPESVSDDPAHLADLTVLTYQLLSVTGDGSPFEDLALSAWIDELVAAGRSEADAATWLAELAVDNASAYRSGIRRRVRRLRGRFARQRPDELASVLHPNAVALMDSIVDAGIRTIVLDECHHLLDHWALVVAYLAGRIRENGGTVLLIGLTATLPSPDDESEFENYDQLLGDVDYEVPTPAVVKEGHLAPYRDHVWFTEPTPAEATFIRRHETLLHELMFQVLSPPDGISFLEAQMQPGGVGGQDDANEDPLIRLDRALAEDFTLTRSCAVVLREIAPQHPLALPLPTALFDRCTTDDLLTVLARFAHTRLLAGPEARAQWEYLRRSLSDFGYHLTDRGIRRGRNPVETTLAYSAAKDHAAVDILRLEVKSADADRIRAVVVTDFVVHGNHRGQAGDDAAGALRVFDLLAHDPVTAAMRPVLITAEHLRVREADASALATALTALLGAQVEISDGVGAVRALRVPGIGSGRIVAAVSELIRRGDVRVLVGTRGLLGEGWDCPAVNTLIDLTAVATSSATQQLRGRTLRLDPAWPQKVAHNWSVSCLIPADVALDDLAEPRRVRRKHSHLWGLDADDSTRIVAGLEHALTTDAAGALDRVLRKDSTATIEELNVLSTSPLPPRAQTHAHWRVGDPYVPREREAVSLGNGLRASSLLRTAPTLVARAPMRLVLGALGVGTMTAILSETGVISIAPAAGLAVASAGGLLIAAALSAPAFVRSLRTSARPEGVYLGAAVAVARSLHEARRIGEIDESTITVRTEARGSERVRIEVGGSESDRRIVADALEELFSPVRTPRFLLRIDQGAAGRFGPSAWLADRLSPGRTLLPVPRMLGRRRADAERFSEHWARCVGSCSLHELNGLEGAALLRIARSAPSRLDPTSPRTRIWG
ncbi:DEAD/DEAH box helicase family protein [Microbacterium sp. TWP3-1-2b2]|uniref:DEAD/DEAH box helicase family protein n=1 Tax=Microbacterium sp. TWP3-1-2b2 TaxID=2804651 RepID=UPI003CE87AE3